MANKLLIEFLADFVANEGLRCKVLRHEWQGPTDYGLTAAQVNILNTFDMKTIFEEARKEIEALGIDLTKKMQEIQGGAGGGGAGAASMYHGGQVHIRKLDPAQIQAGTPARVTVLGNGFESAPQVLFSNGATSILGVVAGTSCDLDLYQRLEVDVTLPQAGNWTVQARNSANEAFNPTDTGTLTVVP